MVTAEDGVGHADGPLVVGDDHELRMLGEALHHPDEAVDVRFVERRVHLVEDAEGARLHHVDREEERHRRHRLLAARHQGHALELLAGGLGDDVDAALERIALVDQDEGRLAAAEELAEDLLEVRLHLLEGLGEHLLGRLVDFLDREKELFLAAAEVGVLGLEEGEALLQFLEFGDRLQIDRTHPVEPLPLFADLGFERGPIGDLPLKRELKRRQTRQDNLVGLLEPLREMVEGKAAFGQFDLAIGLDRLDLGELAPLGTERVLAGGDLFLVGRLRGERGLQRRLAFDGRRARPLPARRGR